MGRVLLSGGCLGMKVPEICKANFADNDWASIIAACHSGSVPSTWVVGNSKTMTINGASYQVDIIGKNHDTYANESAAQSAVAAIDAALASVRDAGGGLDAALAAVDKALPTDAASAQRDGASVFLTFTTPSGRTLDVELTIKANATYEISQWKATTQWTNDGPSTMLWPGAA